MPPKRKAPQPKSRHKVKEVPQESSSHLAWFGHADATGQLDLGPNYANKIFRVTDRPDGNILLEPVVLIHEREFWLFQNPEALATVRKGIEESRAGKGVYLGSFAKYAALEINDDK